MKVACEITKRTKLYMIAPVTGWSGKQAERSCPRMFAAVSALFSQSNDGIIASTSIVEDVQFWSMGSFLLSFDQ